MDRERRKAKETTCFEHPLVPSSGTCYGPPRVPALQELSICPEADGSHAVGLQAVILGSKMQWELRQPAVSKCAWNSSIVSEAPGSGLELRASPAPWTLQQEGKVPGQVSPTQLRSPVRREIVIGKEWILQVKKL